GLRLRLGARADRDPPARSAGHPRPLGERPPLPEAVLVARIPLSWLREYADPPVAAAAIAERLSVSTCEVERIVRLGVPDTTGNRPDLLSIYGLAREVSALFDVPPAPWPGAEPARDGDEAVHVTVEDEEGCPRYVGRLFRDVRVEASPVWLKARISAAGMRPISNVVDVTNYVMLALGNPLHAFDFDTLAGGRVVVRRTRPGESMRTLDGQQRELDPRDLLIADGERAVAIA